MLHYNICFMFWFFGHETCGILAPWPGIEPTPLALEGKVLTTGPPGKPLDWTLECGRWTGQASSRGLVGPSGDAPLAPFRHGSGTSLWVLQGPPDAILRPRPEPRRSEITSCSRKTTAGSSFPPHTRPRSEHTPLELLWGKAGGSHVTKVMRLWSHMDIPSSPTLATH